MERSVPALLGLARVSGRCGRGMGMGTVFFLYQGLEVDLQESCIRALKVNLKESHFKFFSADNFSADNDLGGGPNSW